MIYKNPKGQEVGFTVDNTYITQRKSEGFFIKYQAFAISNNKILLELEKNEPNVDKVKIIYHGTKGIIIYKCNLKQFFESKLYFVDKSMGEEDLQKLVKIKDMIEEKLYTEEKRDGEQNN
jgi:hypothetical protein